MLGRYRRKVWIGLALIGVLAIYMSLDSRLVTGEDRFAAVGRSMDEYAEALKLLTTSYYKPLDANKLTTNAIEGMVDNLDPYTQFLDRRAYEELMIDTRGKLGGLGITISMRGGDVPVVMSVIQGTPADTSGLVVGDRIVQVEGKPTAGKSLQQVVDVLRGDPGSPVSISIDRPGRTAPIEKQIIRASIMIKSVMTVKTDDPEIGYIAMSGLISSRFAETTPDELEAALKTVMARHVKGIILDLRDNPGGLLNQAVQVADKFLGPGMTVVTTKGRVVSQDEDYKTREPSMVGNIPLVILVNGYTASAAEIVSGAIQDSDRGLILGTQTFGKGSVQSIRQIGKDKAIKLTTALYYTPSGRSIHKSSRRARHLNGPILTIGSKMVPAYEVLGIVGDAQHRRDALDALMERFDMTRDQAEQVLDMDLGQMLGEGLKDNSNNPKGSNPSIKFKTLGGRTVYGGGGITPDVKVEPEELPRLVLALGRAGVFFDFAVQYAAHHTLPKQPEGFTVSDDIMHAFRSFLADTTNTHGFVYQTHAEMELQDLKQSMSHEDAQNPEVQASLKHLREVAGREREAEFKKADPFIRLEIQRALANRLWGLKGVLLASLKGDKQYQEAVRILNNPELYKKRMNLAMVTGKK